MNDSKLYLSTMVIDHFRKEPILICANSELDAMIFRDYSTIISGNRKIKEEDLVNDPISPSQYPLIEVDMGQKSELEKYMDIGEIRVFYYFYSSFDGLYRFTRITDSLYNIMKYQEIKSCTIHSNRIWTLETLYEKLNIDTAFVHKGIPFLSEENIHLAYYNENIHNDHRLSYRKFMNEMAMRFNNPMLCLGLKQSALIVFHTDNNVHVMPEYYDMESYFDTLYDSKYPHAFLYDCENSAGGCKLYSIHKETNSPYNEKSYFSFYLNANLPKRKIVINNAT